MTPQAPTLPASRVDLPERTVVGGVGESVARPDGGLKVRGEFAYSSDLWAEHMLWGATVRSPHPRARIRSIGAGRALAVAGVAAVCSYEDVPGRRTFGLEHPDQPVLAFPDVRYQGEAVAIVAADHPETARRAAALVEVDYEPLEPVTDAEAALAEGAPALHEGGNLLRHVRIRRGDPLATADVVVSGTYEVGMQDQAFLGPESGLAIPDGAGGVDLYVATQWLHVDQSQLAASLGLEPTRFGSRSRAWAGPSGRVRTCRSRCTRACWRCTPAGRSRCSTRARSPSSVTCTATRRGSPSSTARPATAGSSTCGRASSSTAAPTPRARPRCAPTPPASRSGRTTSRT